MWGGEDAHAVFRIAMSAPSGFGRFIAWLRSWSRRHTPCYLATALVDRSCVGLRGMALGGMR